MRAIEKTRVTDKISSSYSVTYKKNALLGFMLFGASYLAAANLAFLDTGIVNILNKNASASNLFDTIINHLNTDAAISGAVFIAIIWGTWPETEVPVLRARIIIGALASIVAGAFSRILQYRLSIHPRPYYDTAIAFHPPFGSDQIHLNTWNSFPSDHATVYAGLVTVIWLSGFRYRSLVVVWFVILEIARSYIGAHYPSDLIAGAGLGSAIVWLSQAPVTINGTKKICVALYAKSPFLFFMLAFLCSYQIATLGTEVRGIVGDLWTLKSIILR